jgi:hypothetical protein
MNIPPQKIFAISITVIILSLLLAFKTHHISIEALVFFGLLLLIYAEAIGPQRKK